MAILNYPFQFIFLLISCCFGSHAFHETSNLSESLIFKLKKMISLDETGYSIEKSIQEIFFGDFGNDNTKDSKTFDLNKSWSLMFFLIP